jgi:hypothetical protein
MDRYSPNAENSKAICRNNRWRNTGTLLILVQPVSRFVGAGRDLFSADKGRSSMNAVIRD